MQSKTEHLFELANEACIKAGAEIMKIYETADFGVEMKANNSPLTLADQAAHNAIVNILEGTGIPILSEEGKDIPFEERKNWDRFWLVDPLDGTKEFIKRNGEFTVNIALIEGSESVFGSVYVPVTGILYHGGRMYPAKKRVNGVDENLSLNPKRMDLKQKLELENLTVVASRSHNSPDTQELLDSLANPAVVSMGSSLKFMALAEGKADIYPRFAPTMEWDTAAAHGIISSLGYNVQIRDINTPLRYNKENLLNPHFICY
ncbi:3'(2'),5'-bisphosphate nucleotidase CysQ [bacterium]|nr:3'(2'),5'-bisphosphate nucleotidase CysQ [bacterium]